MRKFRCTNFWMPFESSALIYFDYMNGSILQSVPFILSLRMADSSQRQPAPTGTSYEILRFQYTVKQTLQKYSLECYGLYKIQAMHCIVDMESKWITSEEIVCRYCLLTLNVSPQEKYKVADRQSHVVSPNFFFFLRLVKLPITNYEYELKVKIYK
jgi:hypothetical protein